MANIGSLTAHLGVDTTGLRSAGQDFAKFEATTIRGLMGVTRAAVGAAAAIGVSLSTVNMFKTGFDSVERFKLSVAEATAFITTFSEKANKGDLAGGFKEANEYAMRLIPALEAIDAKTIASGKDLTAMTNTMLQNGVLLDIDNKRQVQGFVNIANALSLVTVGQNKDIQIRQEINALMQGQVRATDRLPKLLAAIDPKLEEHLKLWKEQGTTVEHVGELLAGFGKSADLIEQTWAAVGSSLETIRDKVLRDGFLPVYKDILGLATDIRTSLVDSEGQLTPLAVKIQTSIGGAYKSLKLGAMEVKAEILRIGILLDKMGGTMSFLASLPSAIPAAIGVKSSQDRMQRMADYNINYENRAAEKDAELVRLAEQYNALEATTFQGAAKNGAGAPKLKPSGAIDEKAVTAARKLAEQWADTKRTLEGEMNLSHLEGLERTLQEITNKAKEYRNQFGDKPEIAAWEADAKAVAKKKDLIEATEKYNQIVQAALPKEQQEVAAVAEEYRQKQAAIIDAMTAGATTPENAAALSEALGKREMQDNLELLNRQEDAAYEYQKALEELGKTGTTVAEDMEEAFTGWASNMAKDLNEVLWGAEVTFGGILESFGKMITQMMIQKNIVEPFTDNIGGIIGGIVGAFTGGGSGTPEAFSQVSAYDSMVGTHADFAFAGGGVINEPVIGRGLRSGASYAFGENESEVVLNPRQLSGMGRGGGITINQTIINNTDSEVKTQASPDGQGGINLEVIIDRVVGKKTNEFGSATNKSLRQGFGATPMLASR